MLNPRRQLVKHVDKQSGVDGQADRVSREVASEGLERQPGEHPLGLIEQPRTRVDADHLPRQTCFEQKGRELAATAAEIDDVAERDVDAEPQQDPGQRIVTELASDKAGRKPSLVPVARDDARAQPVEIRVCSAYSASAGARSVAERGRTRRITCSV